MSESYTPRFAFLRPDEWLPNIEGRQASIQRTESEPPKRPQIAQSFLASDYETIGQFSYAMGYPMERVREAFTRAAQAYVRVFELRGTEGVFPVTVVQLDPSKDPGDPARVIDMRPLHPPGSKDHSLTNSREGLKAVYVALAAGQYGLAERLAALLWDPPDARWLKPKSVICTPNEQHLAYAVQKLFVADRAAAESELAKINIRRKDEVPLRFQSTMVRGLAAERPDLFRQGLDELLSWHGAEASLERNRYEKLFYLCLPGAGLSALALRRGLVSPSQLPHDNVYLPLELVSTASPGDGAG
jgi:hypothetical protein